MAPSFEPMKDLPDMTGRVAIVTGSTSGIGLATAAVLLRKGAKVYLAARNEEKARVCLKQLENEGLRPGNGQALFLHLDLADPKGAKKSAEAFLEKEERLDILINNAAMLVTDYKIGFDGIQEIMITNHFSPFIFTETLLPLMKKTEVELEADVRIVNVSSDAIKFVPEGIHFQSKEDFNVDYKGEFFSSFKRYGASKLLNLLWARELQRRLEIDGSDIIVTALHPGAIFTGGVVSGSKKIPWPLSSLFTLLAQLFMQPPSYAAATLTFAAAGATVRTESDNYKGAYLQPGGRIGKTTKAGEDKELAKELWDTTETLVKGWGL